MTLGRIGPAAQDAVPVFIAQIEQRDQLGKPTYAWAARALGLFGVHGRQAAPALVDLLFDEDIPQAYRTLPVEALARIGTSHPDVLPALIRLLQYEGSDASRISAADASVFRELAAEALGIMGPDADLAAPLLIRAIRNVGESESVRRKATVALGSMGARAELAIPALIETLEFGESDALRGAAGEALGKIGLPALPLLQRYLQHSDPQVRASAAKAIGQMGRQARPAVPTMIAALVDPDDEVRVSICESLDSIGADPKQFIALLVQLLTSDLRQVRMRSMRLLIKLGPQVRPQVEQLRQLQQDPLRLGAGHRHQDTADTADTGDAGRVTRRPGQTSNVWTFADFPAWRECWGRELCCAAKRTLNFELRTSNENQENSGASGCSVS